MSSLVGPKARDLRLKRMLGQLRTPRKDPKIWIPQYCTLSFRTITSTFRSTRTGSLSPFLASLGQSSQQDRGVSLGCLCGHSGHGCVPLLCEGRILRSSCPSPLAFSDTVLDVLPLAKGALAIFALRNEATLSATYRSLLPILTLAGRDPRLPDSSKSRLLCHDACLEVSFLSYLSVSLTYAPQVVLAVVSSSQHVVPKKRAEGTRRQPRRVSIESADGEDDAPASSEPANFHGISMPFVCAIGFTQRMMMTSSEKMIPRAQVTRSPKRLTFD
jgi:hypothetical protein